MDGRRVTVRSRNCDDDGPFQPLLEPAFRTSNGGTVSSFTAKSAEPTVEDTGTAQLTAGVATVTLDPTFAATIDKSTIYRVFLTSDGDTRGLFVALKPPADKFGQPIRH